MKQRYSLTSNAVKFRLLTLTLLALLIGGGMKAIGQTAFTLDYTDSDDKTYYVTSTDVVAESANNTDASGPLAYKFYVSESATSLTNTTKYDHFYMVHVNNANATVTFIFQTDKPVGFSNGSSSNENAFKVTKGTLKLKLDKDHYTSDITLRRVGTFTTSQNNSTPFYLINVEGEASDQRLIIEGLDPKPEQLLYPVNNVKQDTATYRPKRQFVIDGAANISSVNMTDGIPTYTGPTTNRKPLFRVETGTGLSHIICNNQVQMFLLQFLLRIVNQMVRFRCKTHQCLSRFFHFPHSLRHIRIFHKPEYKFFPVSFFHLLGKYFSKAVISRSSSLNNNILFRAFPLHSLQ